MAAKTLPEYFIQYRNEINPVTGEQRLYRDISDQMIWDAATNAAEEKFTEGLQANSIAPTTSQVRSFPQMPPDCEHCPCSDNCAADYDYITCHGMLWRHFVLD